MVKRVRAEAAALEPEQLPRRKRHPTLAQSRASQCVYCKHFYLKPCTKSMYPDCPNFKFIKTGGR